MNAVSIETVNFHGSKAHTKRKKVVLRPSVYAMRSNEISVEEIFQERQSSIGSSFEIASQTLKLSGLHTYKYTAIPENLFTIPPMKPYTVVKKGANTFTWKEGVTMWALIPAEFQSVLASSSKELSREVAGNAKNLTLYALIASAFGAVFNLPFGATIIALVMFALFDLILGVIPRPPGLKKIKFSKTDVSPLVRIHTFLYLIFLLATAAFCQIAFEMYINSHDATFIQEMSKSYPKSSDFVKHWLGIANITGYGFVLYYLNRIKQYLVIGGNKAKSTKASRSA